MKCLTFGQTIVLLTVSLYPHLVPAVESLDIPKRIAIEVDGQEVIGFWGDPVDLKEKAQNARQDLAPEGFVYRIQRGLEPRIELAVWSTSKKEGRILKAAEAKLTAFVYDQQKKLGNPPSGFLYSKTELDNYGVESRAHKQKPRRTKKVVPEGEDLSPVLASLPEAVKPQRELGNEYPRDRVMTGIIWIVISLLLLGLAWKQERRS